MMLRMYIGAVLIESVPLFYEGLASCSERQDFQERLARELAQKHMTKIKASGREPVFFVDGVRSTMNADH